MHTADYESIRCINLKACTWKVSCVSNSKTKKVCLKSFEVGNKRALNEDDEGTCEEELGVAMRARSQSTSVGFRQPKQIKLCNAEKQQAMIHKKMGERSRKGQASKPIKEKEQRPRQDDRVRRYTEETKVLDNVDAIFAASSQ